LANVAVTAAADAGRATTTAAAPAATAAATVMMIARDRRMKGSLHVERGIDGRAVF
jgi:hypothetical protein